MTDERLRTDYCKVIKDLTGTIEAIYRVYVICEDKDTKNGLLIEMMKYVKKINEIIDLAQTKEGE